jgi:hypothetical protein
MSALRSEVSTINQRIADAERKTTQAARTRLDLSLEQLRARLVTLLGSEPVVPPLPEGGTDSAQSAVVAGLTARREVLENELASLRNEDATLAAEIDAGLQVRVDIQTLEEQWNSFVGANEERLALLGLGMEAVARLETDFTNIDLAIADRRSRREAIATSRATDVEGTTGKAYADVLQELRQEEELLGEPARRHAEAETVHARWEQECKDVREGTESDPGIANIEAQIADFVAAPARIEALKGERMAVTHKIHAAFLDKVAIYEELYEPARRFIDQHPLAEQCQLSFGAGLREAEFEARLFDIIGRHAVGTFMGRAEGSALLRRRLEPVSFMAAESVDSFLTELDDAMHEDRRGTPATPVELERGLRTGHTLEELYDLMFGLSYLEPHHSLRYRETELDQLSPGEKGTLLLMFYLLVDPSRSPLLLDQPDENLDNQTIKNLLVPAMKEAGARRQVLVVTHNPNVAVVADADQLVVADREDDRFVYRTGAIEDTPINKDVVDVLEGTWPAFRNRQDKYQPPS